MMSDSPAGQTDVVTGGAGFIGRALVNRLTALGHRVVVLDNLFLNAGVPALPPGAELLLGDVRDTPFVQSVLEDHRPRTVYHLAAVHFIPFCEANPAECVSVNTAGAASMLEACIRVEAPPRCVLASTAAVYAPAEIAHREGDRLGPIDIYGLSKLWLEQVAELYAKRNRLTISVARLFNVYGPGETNPHLIPSLVDQALTGGIVEVGNLNTRRDYVHVDDVANALVAMGELPHDDGLVSLNVGSGRAATGQEVVDLIARYLDRTLKTVTDASRLRPIDRPLLLSDSRRAAELLDWRPQVSFEIGLRDLVQASVAAGARV